MKQPYLPLEPAPLFEIQEQKSPGCSGLKNTRFKPKTNPIPAHGKLSTWVEQTLNTEPKRSSGK